MQFKPVAITRNPSMDAYGKLTVKAEGSGNSEGRAQPVYCALTTRVHHQAMKNRDDMSAVIEGLRKDHSLLVAFLEAADKIDWRALHRRVAIGETPEPVNMEAHETSSEPNSLPAFAFRRANLVRASE
jgi:hypothetical protein